MEHGGYILTSYLAAALILGAEAVWVVLRLRRARAEEARSRAAAGRGAVP